MTDLLPPAPPMAKSNLLLIALKCLEEAINEPFDPRVSSAIDALVIASERGWA